MTTGIPADRLRQRFGARLRTDAPLAPLTTFRVGGPADLLVTATDAGEVQAAVEIASAAGLAVTLLGGGSNVLVSDRGIRGLVIHCRGGQIVRDGEDGVRADSGVTINALVRSTVAQGLAGLEAWAGTPGTVGGAVFGNAHFQGHNIGEIVTAVRLADASGRAADVDSRAMEFAYDYSRLHRTHEAVLSARFRVTPGDPARLRATARESLAYRKRTQPLASPSAGCVFQNPDPRRDRVPDGVPPSAGALVDRAGLKGARQGSARVSPVHGNFIVVEGGGTADDVRRLIERCRAEVRQRFSVELRDEIVYLGFTDRPARTSPAESSHGQSAG